MEIDVVATEDRISELPDSILRNEILSRLPTRCAVGTSILSKRWRWLWTGVPTLEFSCFDKICSGPGKATMFMNFVDNVLLHHHILNLRSFKLGCYDICDISRVHSWISTVAHSKLRALYMKIYQLEHHVIPMSVYCCESLMVLKISFPGSVFNPPTSISLPSLTTLKLNGLSFTDEDLMQQLFSSLPALEYLVMKHCKFHNYQKLVVSSPSLNRLRIDRGDFEPYGPYGLSSPIIKVCAPQLCYLYCYTNSLAREYILSSMPVLQEAWIGAGDYDNPMSSLRYERHNSCNLLKDLINVKKLRIPAILVEFSSHEDLMSRSLPFLTNLTCLEVSGSCSACDMLSLLQIMPSLEHLSFSEFYASSEDELTPYIGEMLPQCFHSRIKEIQITEDDGSLEDFPIINFLLNNIAALKITDVIYSLGFLGYPVKTIRLRRDSLDS